MTCTRSGRFFKRLGDFRGIEHFVADGVIDFVEHHQIIFAAVDRVAPGLPAFLGELDVFGIGFRAADFDEAAAHRTNFKFVVAQHFGGIEFAVMPRAFDELHHQHAQPLAHGAKGGAQRAGGLALAGPGVNDQQSFFFRHLQ